jgi:membrane protease YdiL (CAAX protease family)
MTSASAVKIIRRLYANPIFFVFEICLLVVVPLWLIARLPAAIHYRHLMMTLGVIYYLIVVRLLHISQSNLGFHLRQFTPAIKAITPATSITILIILLAGLVNPQSLYLETVGRESGSFPVIFPILAYVLISVPIQEIVTRAFFINRLAYVFSNQTLVIFINALIFAILHTPFQHHLFTLTTFILGLVWSSNFMRYKNIWAVMLSHSAVGTIFIYFICTH